MAKSVTMEKTERIATTVRQFIENNRRLHGWDRSLTGACLCASYLLARLLQKQGVQARMAMGIMNWKDQEESPQAEDADHVWVELQRRTVIDVTATQFGEKYPPVVIAPMGSPLWREYTPIVYSQSAVKVALEQWS